MLHLVYNPLFLDQVHSTNDYAILLLSKSKPIEGTVITTYNQLAGKGQIGRTWFSGSNNNLTLSIILYPTFLLVKNQFYLSICLSLAVSKTIQDIISQSVSIKWPNDIYIDNDKIAGLLIQQSIQSTRISHSILGVGLNVNQEEFPNYLPNPISIYQLIHKKINLDELSETLFNNLAHYYDLLLKSEFSILKHQYLSKLFRRGEKSYFLDSNEQRFMGEIINIDDSGRLILAIENELRSFSMGEISMII